MQRRRAEAKQPDGVAFTAADVILRERGGLVVATLGEARGKRTMTQVLPSARGDTTRTSVKRLTGEGPPLSRPN